MRASSSEPSGPVSMRVPTLTTIVVRRRRFLGEVTWGKRLGAGG